MNDFNMPAERTAADVTSNAQTQALVGRQGQEVQAAVFMAKQFPRDENTSIDKVLKACHRKTLAEVAVYEYPRGGQKVTGPSIRLAEAIAQCWGSIDTGWIELENRNDESVIMAYAWDLETNYRQTKTFTVPHLRVTRKGSTLLTDPRDIYELCANQAARRQRSCILGVIPGDVVETAVKECQNTITKNSRPLADRVADMAEVFANEYGVTVPMLEAKIGMGIHAFTDKSFLTLAGIYRSLHDGMSKVEDWFDTSIEAEEVTDVSPEQIEEDTSGQVDISTLSEPKTELSDDDKVAIEAEERAAAEQAEMDAAVAKASKK